MALQGIDVSRWQGIIDWNAVKASKQLAIIKLGGSDDGFYPDGQGIRNAQEARRIGIPHGFYFYLGGVHDTDDEAQHILNCIAGIGGLQPGESIWLDWEEHTDDEVGYLESIARKLVEKGMPTPGVYMSLSRVRGNDWSRLVNQNNGLWVAAWGDNDAVAEANEIPGSDEWPFWALWQFSSNGSVPGISGRVDLDQFNGDVAQFLKYGAAGAAIPAPTPAPVNPAPYKPVEYTAVPGDNMSKIAANHGMSLGLLKQLNPNAGHPARNYGNIWPGDKFIVSGTATAPVAPAPDEPRYDYVKPGGSMSAVAADNGISLAYIKQLNPQAGHPAGNFSLVYAGDKLRVA